MTPLRLFMVETTPGVVDRITTFCERTGLQFRATPVLVGPSSAGNGGSPDDEPVTPMLLRLERAAEALDCSPTTVKRLIRAGTLPAVKVQGSTRVRVCDLREFVESLADSSTAEGGRPAPTPPALGSGEPDPGYHRQPGAGVTMVAGPSPHETPETNEPRGAA